MIAFEAEKCSNCSICSAVCPHGVIEMSGDSAAIVHVDKCVSCGACQLNCDSEAISVTKGTGCVITIIKEDILKLKDKDKCHEESACPTAGTARKAYKKGR
jgi:NAD-dependent dihydropyrimidine dehydrogenase PreA subunit